MSNAILSVKLCELDDKIARMRSRIQLSEYAGHEKLAQEIYELKRECAESDLTLRDRLKFSKAGIVRALSEAYDEIQAALAKAKQHMLDNTLQDDESCCAAIEEKILLAEYSLDFAMQAADRALLLSLEAVGAQLERQKIEEGSKSI